MSGLEDAVLRNIEAVSELSNLVRTSFGPNGTRSLSFFSGGKVDGAQVEINWSSITWEDSS
jgi:T-complex protein 1 subunit theta